MLNFICDVHVMKDMQNKRGENEKLTCVRIVLGRCVYKGVFLKRKINTEGWQAANSSRHQSLPQKKTICIDLSLSDNSRTSIV